MAEWLGRGLQSLVQQFDSAPRLRFGCVAGALELAREREDPECDQGNRDPDEDERNGCRHEQRRYRGDERDDRQRSREEREAELSTHTPDQ